MTFVLYDKFGTELDRTEATDYKEAWKKLHPNPFDDDYICIIKDGRAVFCSKDIQDTFKKRLSKYEIWFIHHWFMGFLVLANLILLWRNWR